MLVSGVAIGIAAAIAFGGDWRRLANLNLKWWPLLIAAAGMRLYTYRFDPHAPLAVYLLGLVGVGIVAAANWRMPGAALISIGTFTNVLVVALNGGMPYDPEVVRAVDGAPPDDTLHVLLSPESALPFLSDIVPVGLVHGVYSAGDLLIAFGGFLIPFVLLQPRAEPSNRQLRSANFAFFWLAQAISRFGDPITSLALVYVTYRLTESALLSAIALGLGIAANAIFGFVGGAVGDALGPRRAMFWCDVVRTAIVGLIPILLVFNAPLFFVFALAFMAGIAGAIFNPARGALVPALLTPQRLAAGNSLVFATDRAVEIAGQLAGAALVLVLGDGAFYVDALTFALSAVLLARVVVNEPVRQISFEALRRDAADGIRFIRDNVVVRANTLFSFAAQFANPLVNTLTPVLLIRRFANNDALSGAVLFAGAEAAIALGAVVGSAILPGYLGRLHKGRSLLIGFGLTGATIIAISVVPSYGIAIGLFALLGFVNVLSFVPTVTILQQATPQAFIARVFGARIALTNLTWIIILLFGGALAEQIGVDVVLAVAGLVTLTTAIVAAFVPAIRDVP